MCYHSYSIYYCFLGKNLTNNSHKRTKYRIIYYYIIDKLRNEQVCSQSRYEETRDVLTINYVNIPKQSS